jgi:hypothetical protein
MSIMRRIAAILVVVLASVAFAAAQYDASTSQDKDKTATSDKSKAGGMEMTGSICNSQCVKQDAGKTSCDSSCTEKSGDWVFVDDQGKQYKIADQKMAKKHANKKVKMMGSMNGDMMEPSQIVDLNPGPG